VPLERERRPGFPGPASTTTATVDTTKHNGHKPNGLRAILEAAGGSLKSLTVLSPQVDPFRLDTPANHRDGAWLADAMERTRVGKIHDRGLHYVLLTQPKPCGDPYVTADWEWLIKILGAARWLGYIPFDQITDQKNDPPVIRIRPSKNQPIGYVSTEPEVVIPNADDLEPDVGIDDFTGAQPYRIALIGEKSSLKNVLGPISDRYGTDLLLPSGDISTNHVHQLAKAAAVDGRPLVVLYFSDCDPSGWNMPVVLARKLQAFKIQLFPDLEFRCYSAALTPDQVREYGLPESPVKETESRGIRWVEKMGVEQTEIDSVATLRPELLAQIAQHWIGLFYDHSLDVRVKRAADEWRKDARQAIDEQMPELAQRREEVATRLEQIHDEVDELLNDVRLETDDLVLPDLPEIPESEIDEEMQPMPLCDSRWSFTEQCRRLIASKNYELIDEPYSRYGDGEGYIG
jgi:hypothetical protein